MAQLNPWAGFPHPSLQFDIVLALRNQPALENFLDELYDPTSASYRQFVTVQSLPRDLAQSGRL